MSADDPTVSPTETEPALPKVVRVALDKLVLDPNNPRIRDRWSTWPVPRERWTSEDVQRETLFALYRSATDDVRDLLGSFIANGWLDVSPILVRPLEDGLYLVVDGNRRIAALSYHQSWPPRANPILSGLNPDTLKELRCEVLDERGVSLRNLNTALRQTVGTRPWDARNEAWLLRDLQGELGLDVDDLAQRLMISPAQAQRRLDALRLYDSFTGRQPPNFTPSENFDVLEEALRTPAVREWIGWDEVSHSATNSENLRQLFAWMRPTAPEDDEPGPRRPGARMLSVRPVLSAPEHVRSLGDVLADRTRLNHWERQRRADGQKADPIKLDRLAAERAAFEVEGAIEALQTVQHSLTEHDYAEIERLAASLQALLATRPGERALPQNDRPWDHHVTDADAHLQSLHIPRYRGLTSLSLVGLGRINLLVGANNSGKTSVLEAVSLLIHQSDPRAMLSALRRRARWDITTNPEWLAEELPAPAEVRARFGGVSAREGLWTLTFSTSADPAHADPFDLIGRARTLARFGEAEQRSTMELRVGKAPRFTGDGERRWICPTMSQSPFSTDHELIRKAHEQAVILGIKDRVIQFLREQLDDKLSDIELVENHRFRAPHQERPRSPDLSSFGDGVQRAFQIALMLAGAAGGVLLIDELENALHTSLLIPFTRLIQELAVELNVQVFITTHSKETIDAFLFNDYRPEDIVAYGLPAKGSEGKVKRYGGPGLRDAVEGLDLDIRRV